MTRPMNDVVPERRSPKRKRANLAVGVGSICCLFLASACSSQPQPSASASQGRSTQATGSSSCTMQNVLTCTGANRTKLLIKGARKEGQVLWQTTLRQTQAVQPLLAVFNQKYPFIKVKFTVTNTNSEIQTLNQEWSAHRYNNDLVDSTLGPITMAKEGYLQPFYTPELSMYPTVQKSAASGPVEWVSEVNYYLVTAYNTKLIKPSQVPKSYADLLKPQFKGKKIVIGTPSGSGGPFFVGNLLQTMGNTAGKAYLKKLAKQDVAVTPNAGPQEVQAVATGQYEIGLMCFDDQVAIAKQKGQPVNYSFMQPVPAEFAAIGIMKHAPHPDAAALLLDFIVSQQGQTILKDNGLLPALRNLTPKNPKLAPSSGHWKANFVKPSVSFASSTKWTQLFQSDFGS